MQNIENINKSLANLSPISASEDGDRDCAVLDVFTDATFADFKAVTKEQVADLIRSFAKKRAPPGSNAPFGGS